MNSFGISVLSVLNQEYHEEGDDGCGSVDDQLPSVGKMKSGASDEPDGNHKHSSSKRPGAAEDEPVDFGFLARSGSLRRNTTPIGAGFCAGPGALESSGYLSLRRRVWGNGTSPARYDPCLRRSSLVRALQMAVHSCAAVPSSGLHRLFLVGPEGNFAGRFLLGRLARPDANLWVLSDLRRENRNIRCTHPPPRFRDVHYLVCDSGSAFAIPAKRYARHVLYVWRAVYPGVNNSSQPTADSFGGDRRFGAFYPALRTDVACRAPAQSREIGSACYEHRILVVL